MTSEARPLEPSGTSRVPRSRGRRVASILFSVLLGVLCWTAALIPLGQQAGVDPVGVPAFLAFGQALVMLPVCVLLGWRTRWPYLITALGSGVALVLPATPLPALIGASVLLRLRRGPWVWVACAAAMAGTMASVFWDLRSAPTGGSLAALFLAADDGPGPFPWGAVPWLVPLWTVLLVAPFLLTGVFRRLRAERNSAVVQRHAAVQDADVLHGEVSRHVERQELARELHDTLASRLSTLSLGAGALEVDAGDRDPGLAQAARDVRESARRSLDDLRHVIDVLQTPGATGLGGRASLDQIDELLDEAQSAGDQVSSRLFVADAAGCDPAVAHAAYRLVQESLSNARRHAPGLPVRVRMRGGPGSGLTLEVVNRLPPQPVPDPGGGGHGLEGMHERVGALGGTLAAGGTDDAFAVAAWLPWVVGGPDVPAASGSAAAPAPGRPSLSEGAP